MRVFWTNTAVQHLLSIYAYIAQDAPRYGQRVVERLTERSEQIAAFPLSGRMVPEYEAPEVREVIERPYRIIYRIKPDPASAFPFRQLKPKILGHRYTITQLLPAFDHHSEVCL